MRPAALRMVLTLAGVVACVRAAGTDSATSPPLEAARESVVSTLPHSVAGTRPSVAWHSWGRAPFEAAARSGRPVFLNLDVSWSHWSRQMDRENHGDPEVAHILNEQFVCVRVDADERPDIDDRYRRLYAILFQDRSAGHPFLLFLTPRGDLFFGSSYLPRTGANGRNFPSLLRNVVALWNEKGSVIEQAARKDTAVFSILPREVLTPDAELSSPSLESIHRALVAEYNPKYPGFGSSQSPRFPAPWALRFLLARGFDQRDPKDFDRVRSILRAMMEGAITDPLDGGIHRYTTDGQWRRPRFEKLLDVNAAHLWILSLLQQAAPEPDFDAELRRNWSFVIRRFGGGDDGDGGFAAAIASDPPDGDPGAYWCWTPAQVRALLPEASADLAGLLWGIPEAEPGSSDAGTSVALRRAMDLNAAHERMQRFALPELAAMGVAARRTLWATREARPAPSLDRRQFTAANARLVQALWAYDDATGDAEGSAAARGIVERFEKYARRPDGLMAHKIHSGNGGRESSGVPRDVPPFLKDQSAWLTALLDTAMATGEEKWLERSAQLAHATLEAFRGPDGTLLTDRPPPGNPLAPDDEPTTGLIAAPLIVYEDDGAPGPISEFVLGLVTIWQLTGEERWRREAERLLRPAVFAVSNAGSAYSTWGYATATLLHPVTVHIVGHPEDAKTKEFLSTARSVYRPHLAIRVHAPGAAPRHGSLPPELISSERLPAACVQAEAFSNVVHDAKSLETLVRVWGR